jgi:hypothetical protein
MITLTRHQAGRLRGFFLRSVLGSATAGSSRSSYSAPRARTYGRNIGTPAWPSRMSSRARIRRTRRSPCRSTPWPTSRVTPIRL